MTDKQKAFHVVPASPAPVVPVLGGGLFPVRRIFCVGRNYAAHAREMGSDPTREAPFFFTKPADAVLPVEAGGCGRLSYPGATSDLHHELELVVALGAGGEDLDEAAAAACIYGYAVGLDMTRRDLQTEARNKGRPWDTAKAFDASAPISPIKPLAGEVLAAGEVVLTVNGAQRQKGDIADMIWNVPETIASLSRYFRLMPGDLIFTGTPEGVAAVVAGDRLEGRIAGVGELCIEVVARA